MPVTIRLDEVLVRRKKRAQERGEYFAITDAKYRIDQDRPGKGIRFSTLEKMGEFLAYQSGDLINYSPNSD